MKIQKTLIPVPLAPALIDQCTNSKRKLTRIQIQSKLLVSIHLRRKHENLYNSEGMYLVSVSTQIYILTSSKKSEFIKYCDI